MKKVISLLVAVMMIAAFAVPTFAANSSATVTMGYSTDAVSKDAASYFLVANPTNVNLTQSVYGAPHFEPDMASFEGLKPEQEAALYSEIMLGNLLSISDFSANLNVNGNKIVKLSVDAVSYDKIRTYAEMQFDAATGTYAMVSKQSSSDIKFTTKVTYQSQNFLNPTSYSFVVDVVIKNGKPSGTSSSFAIAAPADIAGTPSQWNKIVDYFNVDYKVNGAAKALPVISTAGQGYYLQLVNLDTGAIINSNGFSYGTNTIVEEVVYTQSGVTYLSGYRVSFAEPGTYIARMLKEDQSWNPGTPFMFNVGK